MTKTIKEWLSPFEWGEKVLKLVSEDYLYEVQFKSAFSAFVTSVDTKSFTDKTEYLKILQDLTPEGSTTGECFSNAMLEALERRQERIDTLLAKVTKDIAEAAGSKINPIR